MFVRFATYLLFVSATIAPRPSGAVMPLELQTVRQSVLAQCRALPPRALELCLAVVDRRSLLVESFDGYWRKSEEQNSRSENDLLAAIGARRAACSAGNPTACAELRLFELERRQIAVTRSRRAAARSATYERTMDALRATATLAERGKSLPEWACRVGGAGTVSCSPLAELLAISDAEMGRALVTDLSLWTRGSRLSSESNALVECGDGEVTAARVAVERRGSLSYLSATSSIAIVDRCALVAARARDRLPLVDFRFPDLQQRIFSGLSGFDALEKSCMLGGDSLRIDPFLDTVMAQLREVFESCSNSLGAGGPLPPPPAASPAPRPPGVWENGITSRKAVENWQETGRWVDEQGETHVQLEGRTSTSDGRQVEATKEETYREGQLVHSFERYTYPDGSTEFRAVGAGDETGEGRYESWGYTSPDRSQWVRAGKNDDDSSWYLDSDGNEMETDSRGRLILWKRNGEVLCQGLEQCRGSSDCADPEICSDCRRAVDYTGKIAHDCLASQGNSPLCQQFLSARECCGRDSDLVDPRLVIPDPSGELVCWNEPLDQERERCEFLCRFASDERCGRNCLAAGERIEAPTLLERACLYAYSEACVTSEFPLPVPSEESRPCPEPLPVDEHFLVPPSETSTCVRSVPAPST